MNKKQLLALFGLTEDERDKIASEDFAQPPDGYPCDTQAHLDACAKLIGKAPADEQAAIKKTAMAIAKRKGLELPDSWQDAKMGVAFGDEASIATFGEPVGKYVPWSGPIFKRGTYPAQKIDASEPEYLATLASRFPGKFRLKDTHEDTQSVFAAKLGYASKIWHEGDQVFGSGMIHRAVKEFIGDEPLKVSIEIDRATITPVGLAVLNFPQVPDAQIAAQFGAAVDAVEAEFSGARHSQADADHVQQIHDHACALGATCGSAQMGARHSKADAADIQQMHDLTVCQGATCAGQEAQMGRNRRNDPAPARTPTAQENHMKPETLSFFAANPDVRRKAGISDAEFAEMQAAARGAEPLAPAIEARFSRLQKQIDAGATNALNEAAAAFAKEWIEGPLKKANSCERKDLESMYRTAVLSDGGGIATFGEDGALIKGEAVKTLVSSMTKRPKISAFAGQQIADEDPTGEKKKPNISASRLVGALNRGGR
jgi:hypothetical protein